MIQFPSVRGLSIGPLGCSGSMELAGSASWDSGDQSDQPLHNDSKHWDYCWVHHSSPEHCCALPGVVPDC
jgi:hypothetical protein